MMTSLSPKTRVVLALGTAQTLSWASTYYLAAILAVFPGWLTLWLAILADTGASVLVTLNGMRLLRFR